MNEFRTVIFKKEKDQPKDHRFIQIQFLLAIGLLIAYIFEPSSTRSIVLFVIIAWGFLLHFSHYVFNKEDINESISNQLIIAKSNILLDEIRLEYDTIDTIDIYLDGHKGQYLSSISELKQSSGVANKITIKHNGQTYSRFFRLMTKNHTYDLIHTLNALDQTVKEKISLLKNTERINF